MSSFRVAVPKHTLLRGLPRLLHLARARTLWPCHIHNFETSGRSAQREAQLRRTRSTVSSRAARASRRRPVAERRNPETGRKVPAEVLRESPLGRTLQTLRTATDEFL
jgi:hypothetical protein